MAYYYQDAAAAAHYGSHPIGAPPWAPSYVAGGAPAAAQPPSREVPVQAREGEQKSPEEMAGELLNKLDDHSMWKLAKELLNLGLAKVAKMEAAGNDAGEGDGGGDSRAKAGARAAGGPSRAPPPGHAGGAPPHCFTGPPPPPGAAGSLVLPPPMPAPPDEWGSVPPGYQAQMMRAVQQQSSYITQMLGGPMPLGAAPWDFTPPIHGMPPGSPPAMLTPPPGQLHRQPPAQIQLAKQLPPKAREPERRSRQRTDVDDEDHEGAQEGKGTPVDEATATTMILRNLHPAFTQQGTEAWLDEKGYKGKYDFALFFPARKTSRLSVFPYAFVNFLTPEFAQEFKGQFHLYRFSGEPYTEVIEDNGKQAPPLSIASGRRQGFSENYVRFSHLLDDARNTQCRPFFADESIERLSKGEQEAARKQAQEAASAENAGPEVLCTTFIVRNLPQALSDQEVAREWLNSKGFEGEYDFFLWFPGKKQRRAFFAADSAEQPQGLGYFFVNFKDAAAGQKCRDDLDGQQFDESGERLNVVAARKQGIDNLLLHFRNLGDNGGRVVPWVSGDQADRS